VLYLLVAASKRQDSPQFRRVPGGARYRRRFSLMCSKGERIITRFLSEVPSAQSLGTRGVRRVSHTTSYKSFKGRAFAQSLDPRMAQNNARAIRSVCKIKQVRDSALPQARAAAESGQAKQSRKNLLQQQPLQLPEASAQHQF
jgi:hypothetical protein